MFEEGEGSEGEEEDEFVDEDLATPRGETSEGEGWVYRIVPGDEVEGEG